MVYWERLWGFMSHDLISIIVNSKLLKMSYMVFGVILGLYGDGSVSTGNGRAYFIRGGTIEHSMGS